MDSTVYARRGDDKTSNKGKIIRSISKFAEQWGKDESELDELDTTILSLVNDYPGLNIHQVYRLIRDKKIFKEIHASTIYYRTNSLENSGYLETKKGERNERRCYALDGEINGLRSNRNDDRSKRIL